MKKIHKPQFKCDVFGIGPAVSGVAQAGANVAAAMIASDATKDAAQKSYDAAIETNKTNIDLVDRTNAANLQLAQKQNEWNIEQWNRENEYNSPVHQMALYKQAGLNPVMAQGNFSPAQELQSAPLANQVAPQVSNPMAGAAEIMAQGGLAKANYMKNVVNDAVQVAKGLSELKRQELDNKKTSLLMPHEIEKAALENQQLIGIIDRLSRMNPVEQREALLRCQLLVQSIEYQQTNNRTAKHNERYQKALADAREIETEILKPQIEYLKQMPKAQLINLLSGAFAAQQKGKLDSFTSDYLSKNERMPPNSPWDVLFASIFEKLGLTGNGSPGNVKNGVTSMGITYKHGKIDWSATLGIFGMPVEWIINKFNEP